MDRRQAPMDLSVCSAPGKRRATMGGAGLPFARLAGGQRGGRRRRKFRAVEAGFPAVLLCGSTPGFAAVFTALFARSTRCCRTPRSRGGRCSAAGSPPRLFTLGKSLSAGIWDGGRWAPPTARPALVSILLWSYYSSQILLFGAEITQVYARRHGSRIGAAPPGAAEPLSAPQGRRLPAEPSVAAPATVESPQPLAVARGLAVSAGLVVLAWSLRALFGPESRE